MLMYCWWCVVVVVGVFVLLCCCVVFVVGVLVCWCWCVGVLVCWCVCVVVVVDDDDDALVLMLLCLCGWENWIQCQNNNSNNSNNINNNNNHTTQPTTILPAFLYTDVDVDVLVYCCVEVVIFWRCCWCCYCCCCVVLYCIVMLLLSGCWIWDIFDTFNQQNNHNQLVPYLCGWCGWCGWLIVIFKACPTKFLTIQIEKRILSKSNNFKTNNTNNYEFVFEFEFKSTYQFTSIHLSQISISRLLHYKIFWFRPSHFAISHFVHLFPVSGSYHLHLSISPSLHLPISPSFPSPIPISPSARIIISPNSTSGLFFISLSPILSNYFFTIFSHLAFSCAPSSWSFSHLSIIGSPHLSLSLISPSSQYLFLAQLSVIISPSYLHSFSLPSRYQPVSRTSYILFSYLHQSISDFELRSTSTSTHLPSFDLSSTPTLASPHLLLPSSH